MLLLSLAYALFGFVTLISALTLVNLLGEPEECHTSKVIAVCLALWPVIWLTLAYSIVMAALVGLRDQLWQGTGHELRRRSLSQVSG